MPSNKILLFIDNGLYTHVAEALSKYYRVLYWSPWVTAFPSSLSGNIGKGLEGIERVYSIYGEFDQVDLFFFPDLYYADLQQHLRAMGKRVWGAGKAEWLELQRWEVRKWMKDVGLPVPKSRSIIGTEKLRSLLQNEDDLYVKPVFWRGDSESWHHEHYFMSEPILEDLEYRLGVRKSDIQFLVESPLPDRIEIGYDGFTIDGEYPEKSFFGIEVKDHAYLGKFTDYESMPEAIRTVNDKLSQVFAENKARGFFSTEIRVGKDGIPYLIDPTIRIPSPPGELYFEAYENIEEIIWEGADGNLVTPQCKYKYGAQAIMISKSADHDWIPMEIDSEVRPFVKIKQHMIKDDHDYVVPMKTNMSEIGSVIGFGNTIEEAVSEVMKHAEGVHALGLEVRCDSLKDATECVSKAKEYGIEF